MSQQPVDQTVMVEMIFPEQANHYGTLFGGTALSLMARAAFVAATRRVRGAVVMARSEQVNFTTPVRVGELLELRAEITRLGRSSLSVAVTGVVEEASTGTRRDALNGQFEMVAVDASGRPRALTDNPSRKEETA
ncbi:acyl-CoA thioesterase [Pararhodobacter aggregans]|uniref:Acyl-CoA thioesterase n=1 Tax=Pararhodobacter aggregans TaxID=404875 RepID=A0A2T7UUT4_9RHOB|nr:hotdog domain-containing protein [Pararhodobacter aggregans]PTX04112.1 acyl-CoA hydrolase [Pararhodobacter aggregans]PVE48424.1 acyl-CoA thioesterase [Pararhodobacter aggregans]